MTLGSRGAAVAAALAAAGALAVQAGAGAGANDACALLTRAEVTTAIGEPLATVKGGGSATGAIFCNWTGKDSHLFSKGIALIAARDSVPQRYKGYASLLKKATAYPGVGTAAVTDGTVIVARSGRAVVQIGPLSVGSGLGLPTLAALARKALARA